MTKNTFKFSNIIFYASILVNIVYFSCEIGILNIYDSNQLINETSKFLSSIYILFNMIFVTLFFVYLSKANKKLKFLSIKFKINLKRKGIINYSLQVLLVILLVHLIGGLTLKISFINSCKILLSPMFKIFININVLIFTISLIIYAFLVNFFNACNKLSKIESFIKKSIKKFSKLLRKIKTKIIYYIRLFILQLINNFKVNHILVFSLQWQEIFRKSLKLNNIRKACAPGIILSF